MKGQGGEKERERETKRGRRGREGWVAKEVVIKGIKKVSV